jgi:hypothetical protein
MNEPIDLRQDNRLPELLAERERQAAAIPKAKRIKDEVESEDGWSPRPGERAHGLGNPFSGPWDAPPLPEF